MVKILLGREFKCNLRILRILEIENGIQNRRFAVADTLVKETRIEGYWKVQYLKETCAKIFTLICRVILYQNQLKI